MQNFKNLIKIGLTIIAITTLAIFCIKQPSIIDYLMAYRFDYLIIIFGLYSIFYILNACILYFVLKPYGEGISFFKVLGINQLSSFFNYILPFRVASIGIKVVLLKKHFNISSGETIGTFTLMTIVYSFICFILLVTSIHFLGLDSTEYQTYLKGAYIAIVFFLLTMLFCVFDKKYSLIKAIKLPKFFLSVKESILPVSTLSLLIIIFLYLMQVLISSYITYALFLGANYKIDFSVCLLLSTIGNLSGIIALTPTNIGIKELTYVGTGAIFGIPSDIIIAVLLLDRFLQLLFLSLGVPCFYSLKSNNHALK